MLNYLQYKLYVGSQSPEQVSFLDKLTIKANWETLVSPEEKTIIEQHASNTTPSPDSLGQMIDIFEVKEAGKKGGYFPPEVDYIYLFKNTPYSMINGEPYENYIIERVYVCFFELGLLIVSGDRKYSFLYDDLKAIAISDENTMFVMIPETLEHDSDIKVGKAEYDQYYVKSPVVAMIVRLFTVWIASTGHNIEIFFEER